MAFLKALLGMFSIVLGGCTSEHGEPISSSATCGTTLKEYSLGEYGTVCLMPDDDKPFHYNTPVVTYYGCLEHPSCPDNGNGGYPQTINGNGGLGGACGVYDTWSTIHNNTLQVQAESGPAAKADGGLAWKALDGTMITGIAAVNFKMLGLPTGAHSGGPGGHAGCTWNFRTGSEEGSNVCYTLTGPSGKKANVLIFDGCAGYPGSKDCCWSATERDCSTDATCDWCAANDHPHFDLDTTTFGYLCDGVGRMCELGMVEPFVCTDGTAANATSQPPVDITGGRQRRLFLSGTSMK